MKLQEQFEKETGQILMTAEPLPFGYVKWLESRIESIQSANQWVSVKDRLPFKDQIVDIWKSNIYNTFKRIENVRFDGEWFCDMVSHYDKAEISHWREQPAAPVKEGEG